MSKPKKRSTKKSKEWLRRSKAAKLGWETRKAKELPKKIRRVEAKIATAKRISRKKKNKSNSRITSVAGKTRKQLQVINKKLEKRLEKLEREFEFKDWVDSEPSEMLHRDRSIALYPCRVRHAPDAPRWVKDLRNANRIGKLREAAEWYSIQLDIPLQEVFTLFHSP